MAEKKRVLLVDDDILIAMSEGTLLNQEGYEVLLADSGEDAIEKVDVAFPEIDLILMDIDLGKGMDGTQVAQEILKKHDIPIIFLSSHTNPEMVEKTEKITSYGFVVKEFDITVLLASMKMAFKLHAAHQALQRNYEKLSLAQEASRAATWELDIPHHVFNWSPAFQEVFGVACSTEQEGRDLIQFVHPEDQERVRKDIQDAIDRKIQLFSDFRLLLPGQEICWVRATGKTYYNGDVPLRMIGLCMDVTERKRSEHALQQYTDRFMSIAENIQVYIAFVNADSLQYEFVNDAFEKLTGKPREKIIGHHIREVIGEDKFQLVSPYVEKVRSGEAVSYENIFDVATGQRWLKVNYAPLLSSDGKVNSIVVLCYDITELKQREEALRLKTKESEAFFHNALDLLSIADMDCTFLRLNEEWSNVLGYPLDELEGHCFLDFIHPEDVAPTLASVRDLRNKKAILNFTNRYRCLDGSYRWIEWRSTSEGKYIYSAARDITARIQLEVKLRESERRYRTLVETADDTIVLTDLQGKHLFRNSAYYTSLGYEVGDDVDLEGFGRVHPDDLMDVRAAMQVLFQKGRSSGEYRVQHRDGRWLYRYNKASLIYDLEGRPQTILSVIRDITERKLAEQKLVQSEKLFRALVDNSYDAITLVNREGITVYQSPAVVRLTGFSMEELTTHNALTNVYADDLPVLQATYADLLTKPGKVEHLEFRSVRKDGTMWWTEATVTNLLEEPGVQAIVVNFRDITERKRAEVALRESEANLKRSLQEKEVLMQELQHRVKNSLILAASLLSFEERHLPDADTRAIFANTRLRFRSISAVYEQLYRGGRLDQVNMRLYIQNLVGALAQSYTPQNKPVHIELQLEDVELDVKRTIPLGIILNELMTNAFKYAFPEENLPEDGSAVIRVEMSQSAGQVKLGVFDNGVGISVEPWPGNGVGLELVRMLVKQIEGVFTIENRNGCAAQISFPLG